MTLNRFFVWQTQSVEKVSEISLKDFAETTTGRLLLRNSLEDCLPRSLFGRKCLNGDGSWTKIQAYFDPKLRLRATYSRPRASEKGWAVLGMADPKHSHPKNSHPKHSHIQPPRAQPPQAQPSRAQPILFLKLRVSNKLL